MTQTIEYAKAYAGKGWQVFPLRPREKTPAIKWADVATNDAATFGDWWRGAENIGIATGARSGIVVLDVDAGHGGEESLAALVAEHGDLPETVTAKTGGGGRHIIFNHPGVEIHNSAGKLGAGLDIRGDGGYIVAPPSIHPNGNAYQWTKRPSQTPLADLPQWIIDALVKPADAAPAPALTLDGVFPAGTRNQNMISLAGTMRRRGMTEAAIYQALLVENKTRCVPPLDDREVAAIAANVMRYEPTAAPAVKVGERIATEWAFAKVMVSYPESVGEFLWLSPEQFSESALAHWWAAVQAGKSPGDAATEGGIFLQIDKAYSNPLDLDRYAAQIVKYARLDRKAYAASQIARLAGTGDEARIDQIIADLAQTVNQAETVRVKSASENLADLVASLHNRGQFVKTGIDTFDALIGGLERKKISVLAARPSVGKTTFAWQIARNAAAAGYRVLFLSLEVSAVSLWRKAALGIAEVSAAALENGKVAPEIIGKIEREIVPELSAAYNGNLYIYDNPPYDLPTLERAILQTQPDLIVCDHLGYVSHSADNEVHRLGEIMKWGKAIAKRTNTHFMAIHQLNRDLEKRERKEPQLSDLRDSGKVEEDADIVIMPYRPAYHADTPTMMRYNETQIYIRKNRDGALGAVPLYMDMLHQWFYRRHEIPANYSTVKMEI